MSTDSGARASSGDRDRGARANGGDSGGATNDGGASSNEARFGRAGATLTTFVLVGVVAAGLCALSIALLASPRRHTSAVAPAVVAAASGLAVLDIVVVAARRPRGFYPRVVATDSEVTTPERGWYHVPIGDIAGIGLTLRRTRLPNVAGRWALTVWRTDGSSTRVTGVGLVTTEADPGRSAAAQAAADLHRHVLEVQGPGGPLAKRALQAHLSPVARLRLQQAWDPTSDSAVRPSRPA